LRLVAIRASERNTWHVSPQEQIDYAAAA